MIGRAVLNASISTIVSILLPAIFANGGFPKETRTVDFCDVVTSPAKYFGQVLSVHVILWPGEHVLTLFGAACVPKEGYDVTTQAILPAKMESLPNGKKLERILKRQRPAQVDVVGIFENREQSYGLDATRFRFTISEVHSVSEVASNKSSH